MDLISSSFNLFITSLFGGKIYLPIKVSVDYR